MGSVQETFLLTIAMEKTLALVLGSGSARGWAHIGVIEALEEAGIKIDFVAGTSIGALIGAIYAAGELARFKSFLLSLDAKKVISYLDAGFPQSGLLAGQKVHQLIAHYIGEQSFKDCKVPLIIIATDLLTGEEIKISSGQVTNAVRASISIPGIFAPVKHGSSWLVDGGLTNPVPVSAAREMGADIVLAVDLSSDVSRSQFNRRRVHRATRSANVAARLKTSLQRLPKAWQSDQLIERWFKAKDRCPNIFEVLDGTVTIVEAQLTLRNFKLAPPDILVQPKLGDLWMFDFARAERSITEGYERTIEQLPAIRAALLAGT